MRPEWVNEDIEKLMKKLLELTGCDPEDLMGAHAANNWNDCAGLKEDLKVI